MAANLESSEASRLGSGKKARVLVVEDHPFIREGIVALVNRQEDLNCCGHADSLATAPAMLMERKPDLVLLDLRLKDGESFELINSFKTQAPEVPILVLSQSDESVFAERVLRLGAKGYIMKQEAPEDLLTAMRAVLAGKVYVSQDIAGA